MTVQLIILGTRRPDTDNEYGAYRDAVGPLVKAAGGVPNTRWGRTGNVAGEGGPKEVMVIDFPDEESIRALFDSPAYQAIVSHRDVAYEIFDGFIASAG